MKFMYFCLPSIPATPQERKDLRPIAHHTERWQKMFDEVAEIARMVEDLGFTGVAFPSTICIPRAWKSAACRC